MVVFVNFLGLKNVFNANLCLHQISIIQGIILTEVVNPFSVIEWHCNITEYSYANHDDHPHLHKHDELLHVSFVDNNFYDAPLYKEISKEIMFIPLRKGLREIREIILTPLDVNGDDIQQLKDVVYLQLKEE